MRTVLTVGTSGEINKLRVRRCNILFNRDLVSYFPINVFYGHIIIFYTIGTYKYLNNNKNIEPTTILYIIIFYNIFSRKNEKLI